jgi:hypothetical protein
LADDLVTRVLHVLADDEPGRRTIDQLAQRLGVAGNEIEAALLHAQERGWVRWPYEVGYTRDWTKHWDITDEGRDQLE